MIIIKHRQNTIKQLKELDIEYGAEIDIRSYKNKIVLSHDPFKESCKLIDWLKEFRHRFIIFNIKEEGLEFETFKLIKQFRIKDFFFLDQSFSFYIRNLERFGKNSSIRISEFETIDRAVMLGKYTKWLWIDHFNKFPLSKKEIIKLNSLGFKFCIVSPELISRSNLSKKIYLIKNAFRNAKTSIDAVCTKNEKLWEE